MLGLGWGWLEAAVGERLCDEIVREGVRVGSLIVAC